MDYIIKPKNFGINEKCRVCVKNINTNKFEELIEVEKNGEYKISKQFIDAGILNYKFKIQVRISGNTWKDKVNYFFLLSIRDFWTQKAQYTDDEVLMLMDFYFKDENRGSSSHIRAAFNKAVSHIEKSKISELTNMKKYLSLVNELNYEIPHFWKNINVYLKHLYRLRIRVTELKLRSKTFPEMHNKEDSNNLKFHKFLKDEIKELEEYELEFADFLAGRHYSFFGMREKATSLFKNYLNYDHPLVKELFMSRGITTYFDVESDEEINKIIPEPTMLGNKIKTSQKTVILMSMDTKFLKKYGIQVFFNCIILKRYHFHIHIIGENEEVNKTLSEALSLFRKMAKFYESEREIIEPTFSTEEVPNFVKQKTTYYACSRFLHAAYFMELFNSNILVMDADYTITGDLKDFLQKIEKLDVGMSIRNPMQGLAPWTRNMGGSVFLKNNNNAKKYINHVKKYMFKGLEFKDSWILDQNALAYANEKVIEDDPNFNIHNIPYEIKPFRQTEIRYYIEGIIPR